MLPGVIVMPGGFTTVVPDPEDREVVPVRERAFPEPPRTDTSEAVGEAVTGVRYAAAWAAADDALHLLREELCARGCGWLVSRARVRVSVEGHGVVDLGTLHPRAVREWARVVRDGRHAA
jgi:hypothetical protein